MEDIDVEFPEPVHDNLESEADESEWRKCSFRVSITGSRWLPMMMQIHSQIYSVKANVQAYDSTVRRLAKEIDTWEASFPPEMTGSTQSTIEDRVCALYLDCEAQHLRLLLHHPSRCITQNQDMAAKNLDICSQASAKLLRIAEEMRVMKSLDITWFNTTVFLAAIFTTLFAFSERKDQMTSSDLTHLRSSMDAWLDIMGDIGNLLGRLLQITCMHGRSLLTLVKGLVQNCRMLFERS